MLAEDDILRMKFKEWINEIWKEKDELISSTNFNHVLIKFLTLFNESYFFIYIHKKRS